MSYNGILIRLYRWECLQVRFSQLSDAPTKPTSGSLKAQHEMGAASGTELYLLLKHICKEHYRRSFICAKKKKLSKVKALWEILLSAEGTLDTNLPSRCLVTLMLSDAEYLQVPLWSVGKKNPHLLRPSLWSAVLMHSCCHYMWNGMDSYVDAKRLKLRVSWKYTWWRMKELLLCLQGRKSFRASLWDIIVLIWLSLSFCA